MSGILDDFPTIDEFALEVRKNPRTIRRWTDQPDGLPYTQLGNQRLIHRPTAREWLLSGMRNPAPRRDRNTTG